MRKALITGICGFVGSHLAEYLLANTDWEIYGLMRWDEPTDNIQDIMHEVNGGRVHLIQGDLEDAQAMMHLVQVSQPDYVFHLAAQSYVQASFVYPNKTFSTNILGTENLLFALYLLRPEAVIHNCSSSEVYGKIPADYGKIAEDGPLVPASPYSISKVAQDMIGRFYHEAYHLRVMTTRMFTHTGPRRGDVFAESTFAKQVAMCEAGLIDTIKVGNLNSLRTIADVRDAVRAYYMLLTVNPQPGEIYNIGGTHTCLVEEILDYLNGGRFPVEQDPDRMRPLDANYQIPDCSKFMAHTGWKPEIPYEKTLDDLLNYWRVRIKHMTPIQR